MEKPKRHRPSAFKVEIPGDSAVKDQFMGKIHKLREILVKKLQRQVNSGDILGADLDAFWNKTYSKKKTPCIQTAVPLQENDTEQDLYIISKPCIEKLINLTQEHTKCCQHSLALSKVHYRGHVAVCKVMCKRDKGHQYWWASSPQLPQWEIFSQ